LNVKQDPTFLYIIFYLRNYSDEAATSISPAPTERQLLLHECKLQLAMTLSISLAPPFLPNSLAATRKKYQLPMLKHSLELKGLKSYLAPPYHPCVQGPTSEL